MNIIIEVEKYMLKLQWNVVNEMYNFNILYKYNVYKE